jgi:hypothetical protein
MLDWKAVNHELRNGLGQATHRNQLVKPIAFLSRVNADSISVKCRFHIISNADYTAKTHDGMMNEGVSDDIMQIIIDIPADLVRQMDALAEHEKISRAEIVQRAMAEYLAKRSPTLPDAAFGIWKSKRIDPLSYEDSLRGR